MLALILYIVAALSFIAAVVLLSFIPNKAVKVIVLILFCLLFVVGTMYLMLKTSGQSDLESMFDALSPSGQTQGWMQSVENTAPPAPTQAAASPVPHTDNGAAKPEAYAGKHVAANPNTDAGKHVAANPNADVG